MERPLNESAWRRGWNDTKSVWTSWPFYVLDAVVAAVIAGIFTWHWGLAVVVFSMICVWMGATFRAPYKQRNELRHALEKLSQTPLVVECNSYEKSLVGKTWLEENQYLWLLNVILTNQSDAQNVSTKAVSLKIHYPVASENIRSYALSIIPNADRDQYGRSSMASGSPLAENEYLHPRESKRGFYQFLDVETFGKPKSIQTWPTLVVVDSFGATHRREFPRPRFATQSNPDKEVSQT